MSTPVNNLKKDLMKLANPVRAQKLLQYFRTGKGEYGEGDRFLGLTVPQCRGIVKKYRNLSTIDTAFLLKSKYHEERLIVLLILVHQFEKGDEPNRQKIYQLYLSSTKYINNWDLVDLSAPRIVGGYLLDKDWSVLKKLAKSQNLWERRIAVLASSAFINKGNSHPTLEISTLLLKDKHDLIHKAVGWMLREVGKSCGQSILEDFLKKHYSSLPRTTLHYAIERFPASLRRKYLEGEV